MSHGVIHSVAQAMMLSPADILCRTRVPYIVKARKVCAVILRDRYGMSFGQIARVLRRSDHTTTRHAYIYGLKLIEADERLAAIVLRHMTGPKLPSLIVERFEPGVDIPDRPRMSAPLTIARYRASYAERAWQAKVMAA